MLIIIWSYKKNKLFLRAKNHDKILFLDKICHLKKINDRHNITLLIDGDLLNGNKIIEEYNYSIDELFITTNVKNVIAINVNKYLKEICDYYNVNLISIN